MYTIAFVCSPWDYFSKEDYIFSFFFYQQSNNFLHLLVYLLVVSIHDNVLQIMFLLRIFLCFLCILQLPKLSKVHHKLCSSSYLPSTTRLFAVASFRIFATSIISTIKVLCPMLKSSDAPTLVKILSTTPMCADVAGTNECQFEPLM